MKLFGSYTSPFVRHCRIVLADTHLDCEFIETDYQTSKVKSPTSRVPFLQDTITIMTEQGDDTQEQNIQLYDSSSIIHYLRDKAEQEFLSTPHETEVYALANTVLDTLINLFLLERHGISDSNNPYLKRHYGRALDTLALLNDKFTDESVQVVNPLNDAHIRVACMLEWCQFRNRADISVYPNLLALLQTLQTWDSFSNTAPSL